MTNRQPFKSTHLATGTNNITHQPFRERVMVVTNEANTDDRKAFTEEQWNLGMGSAQLLFDPGRGQWCFAGGYEPVQMKPL